MGMSNLKREANYRRQELLRTKFGLGYSQLGARSLTPAQNRRMRKAHNKRWGSLQNLAAAGRMAAKNLLKLQATPCPVCGLTGDPSTNPCMTKSGGVASRTHKGRVA